MKKLIIYIASFAMLLAMNTSCEDMGALEEHPKKVDATTFMANAEEVESIINSIYFQLRRDAGFSRYLIVLEEGLADYCMGRGNYASTFTTGLTSGGVGFSKDSWAVLYRSIRFANNILNGIGSAPLTQQEYNHLTGETRFLRAFAYSWLARNWGAVPFFDEQNMNDFNKPRTPEADIWKFVIDEADYAASNLPETAKAAGRPSRYAALALKTEACLYAGRYQEAAEAAGQIISSKRYSLVEISQADDFIDLFGHTANATSEEIFYMKFNRDSGSTLAYMYLCKPNSFMNMGALGVYTDYQNNKFIQNWDQNDLRYQYGLYKQTQNGTLNALTRTGMFCSKFRDSEWSGSNSTPNDNPVYRYADILLYYAEAVCRSNGGPTADAMEKLNMVHRRAYGLRSTQAAPTDYRLTDYASQDAFLALVLKERGYETIFEGKRYNDLKRCGKLAEAALEAGRISNLSEVGDAAYWWPIPTDEFNYNTALDPTKDQNPGY